MLKTYFEMNSAFIEVPEDLISHMVSTSPVKSSVDGETRFRINMATSGGAMRYRFV